MIKTIGKLTLVTILAAVVLGVPIGARAQDKTMPAPAAPADSDVKAKAIPFRGKIGAVDTVKMTLTLEGKTTNRVFEITSTTKLMKAGKPATLADATVGEPVTGQYTKTADGKYLAKSVYIGGRTAATQPAPAAPAPAPPK
jgi:hypothetical protein